MNKLFLIIFLHAALILPLISADESAISKINEKIKNSNLIKFFTPKKTKNGSERAPDNKKRLLQKNTVAGSSDFVWNTHKKDKMSFAKRLKELEKRSQGNLENGFTLNMKRRSKVRFRGNKDTKLETREPNGLSITAQMVKNAVVEAGYPQPSDSQASAFVSQVKSHEFSSNIEAAMLLAHALYESDGLKDKSDPTCEIVDCSQYYKSRSDVPGKIYSGRGYIQLTYAKNYQKASDYLYHDDRLLQNPEIVSNDDLACWGVAIWYWKIAVSPDSDVQAGAFGASTRIITTGFDCSGLQVKNSKTRFSIYKRVLQVFDSSAVPIEKGCYV